MVKCIVNSVSSVNGTVLSPYSHWSRAVTWSVRPRPLSGDWSTLAYWATPPVKVKSILHTRPTYRAITADSSINRSNYDARGRLSVRRSQLINWSIIRSSLDGISDAGQLLLTHTSPRYGSKVQAVLTSPLALGLWRYTYGYLPRRSQVAMNKLSSVRRVGNRTLVHWVTRLTTRPSTHRVTVIVR